jgi:hypothetical protein
VNRWDSRGEGATRWSVLVSAEPQSAGPPDGDSATMHNWIYRRGTSEANFKKLQAFFGELGAQRGPRNSNPFCRGPGNHPFLGN